MLLLCREAFAPTEGGGAVRCGGITGGVEDLEREKEGPNEGGRGRKRRNDKRERKEGWWNGIERRGRRRGWRRAGGEAKSMHRGGMQRAPSNTGPYVRVHSTALYDAPFFSLTLSVTIHAHASCVVSVQHRIRLDARNYCIYTRCVSGLHIIIDAHFRIRKCSCFCFLRKTHLHVTLMYMR